MAEVLDQHPDKIEKLILVDAGGYPRDQPPSFALRMFRTPVLGHIVRHVTPRFMIARSVREAYGDPSRVSEARIDEYQDCLLREGNREATRVRLSAAWDDGLQARLPEIKAPTLILWGTLDRWIAPKDAKRFAADIRSSQPVMLDGLGHVPMEEDAAASVAPVRAFLVPAP